MPKTPDLRWRLSRSIQLRTLLALVGIAGIVFTTLQYLFVNRPARRTALLRAELAAKRLDGVVSEGLVVPDFIYVMMPPAFDDYCPLAMDGVEFTLSGSVAELDFLAKFPEIAAVEFYGGVVQTSVVRSLRNLPALQHLGFQDSPSIRRDEILAECANWPNLKQLCFYGSPFPVESLDAFRSLRPDITIYLGWAPPLQGPPHHLKGISSRH